MKTSDIDKLVLAYRVSESPRCRNALYNEIRMYYLATMYRVKNTFDKRYHCYIESEFDLYLLQCIERWRADGKAMFTTYAYVWMNQKLKTSVVEKYVSKSRREPSFSDIFDDDDDKD